MKIDEKRFLWMVILYNCNYRKKFIETKSGVFSDFERVLGREHQDKTIREFLKELIKEGAVQVFGERIYNNIKHTTYIIDRDKIKRLIEENKEYFKNIKEFIDSYKIIPI